MRNSIAKVSSVLSGALERARVGRDTLKREKTRQNALENELAEIKELIEICQGLDTLFVKNAINTLENLTNYALRYVFGDTYTFKINQKVSRNNSVCELTFTKNGKSFNPINAMGGGVVDLVGFCLRIGVGSLHNPAVGRVFILDEPFKFVSKDYLPKVAELLEELSRENGFQFIIVTHLSELEIGNVIKL